MWYILLPPIVYLFEHLLLLLQWLLDVTRGENGLQIHLTDLQFHPLLENFGHHLEWLFPFVDFIFKVRFLRRVVKIGGYANVFIVDVEAVLEVFDDVHVRGVF